MPLSAKYQKIKDEMISQYGKEKGEQVFYATANKEGWNIDEKTEKKSYIFYSSSLKSLDDNSLGGYISTGDIDLVNDIVTPNCMHSLLTQLKNRSIKLDIEHESFKGKDFEREINKTLIPIGKIIDSAYDGKGIPVKAILNSHHSRYDEVKGSIKDGFLDAFSIAYVPTKFSFSMKDGKRVRMLDDVNLLNVALTGNPINPHATITSVFLKSIEDGGISMSDEKKDKTDKEKEEEEEAAKKKKEEEEEEKKKKAEVKSLTEQVGSMKTEIAELKAELEVKSKDAKISAEKETALTIQLKSLDEKVAGIDKVLSAPQFKARMDSMDANTKTAVDNLGKKAQGPLDHI